MKKYNKVLAGKELKIKNNIESIEYFKRCEKALYKEIRKLKKEIKSIKERK